MNDIQEFLSNFKTIKTIIVFAFGILLQIGTTKSLNNIRKKFGFQKRRFIIINKIISVIVYTSVIIIISFIWVDENQLIYFISSFLTILGIAFFAQWSILSNITAGLILFVNYPVKIGDEITILEKDNNITGEIKDIGAFFITLQTEDKELITVPNSIVLQRNIKFKEKLK
ncbi:mechanosensitive ion channel domain-containing protein [Polaribacter sp.]|jgi:small-conductance mechanosensitive channel|uniref:mechanosensitive ion channel domain-containing protein n=1 Tax=Polaribacter sp. TaxID=1920175 RepID=UPI004047EB2A